MVYKYNKQKNSGFPQQKLVTEHNNNIWNSAADVKTSGLETRLKSAIGFRVLQIHNILAEECMVNWSLGIVRNILHPVLIYVFIILFPLWDKKFLFYLLQNDGSIARYLRIFLCLFYGFIIYKSQGF